MDKDKIQQGIVIPAKENPKRKILEAATGTAWGAKSYSAAKIHLIKDGGNDSGYDNFSRYFAEKQRKLREQYLQESTSTVLRDTAAAAAAQHSGSEIVAPSETPSGRSNTLIFQGVSIFVDGFTIPTHQELRFIMMRNGGVFENYFSRQKVTHIICTTLPDNKITNPRMLSRGLPIVKPEWIVESIKANRLLAWENYQLERIAYAHPRQQTIAARFAAVKKVSVSEKAVVAEDPRSVIQVCVKEGSEHGCSTLFRNEPVDANKMGNGDFSRQDAGSMLHDETEGKLHSENPHKSSCLELVHTADKNVVDLRIEHIAGKAADDSHLVEKVHAARLVEPKAVPGESANRPFRSSKGDTDFVKNFFKCSRLHFIGTWRTRYQSLASTFGKDGALKSRDRQLMEANSDGKPMIIHIDMDCFFVSVVLRNRPDLFGKPVAVCHSDSDKGTAEISSANYPARSYGITAGMYVRSAKALCPDLKIVSYDFAGYEEVADKFYNILHHHCYKVEAVSCDEAFLDVTGHPDPADLASRIREEIYAATRCYASAGIAENLLLARLATKRAKPNGQYWIKTEEVRHFMAALPVKELPGVGWALEEKLQSLEVYNCADLLSISKDNLQKHFGMKTGNMLWCFSQGIDHREVQPAYERKSVGAEVNWGVRFESADDAQNFLINLSNEVASRLQSAGISGRTITLKIKKRKENAGEPAKFLGHGVCDSLSRSETLGYSTNSADVLLRIGRQLYASLHIDPEDVRGMGLQVSRLQTMNAGIRKRHQALDSWLAPSRNLYEGNKRINEKKDPVRAQEDKPEEPYCIGPDRIPTDIQMLERAPSLLLEPVSIRLETDEAKYEEKDESRGRENGPYPPSNEKKRRVQQVLHRTGQNDIKLRTPPKGQRQVSSPLTKKVKGKIAAVKSKRSPLTVSLDLPAMSRFPQQSKAARKVSFPVAEQGGVSGLKQSTTDNKSFYCTHGSLVKPESELVLDKELACSSDVGHTLQNSVGHSLLREILEWVSLKNCSGRLSSHLLSSGCYLPMSGCEDNTGLETLIQQCAKVLKQYARDTASRDLEELHLILCYMKRLGGRCKLWRAIEELTRPAFKDIICEIYGGRVTLL